jgi:AcrR family transcriptional regulator
MLPDVTQAPHATSVRQQVLLERAYEYVLANGLADLSLRPLAAAVGSSPRVLLFLFGSKDGLVRAILARARQEEMALLQQVRAEGSGDLADLATAVWQWLSAPERRRLLVLWSESYVGSLVSPEGPWAGFALDTVEDWLGLLAEAQPPRRRHGPTAAAERTLVLALLRGALLDLLATGDEERTTAAVQHALAAMCAGA